MREKWQERLLRLGTEFDEIKAFSAIRQGLIMMIPLIVPGAFATMLKSLPIDVYQEILPTLLNGRLLEILNFISAGTFEIFSVALAITTSVSYAMIKDTKVKSERAVVNDCFILAVITLISLMGYMGIQYESFTVTTMGTTNTFMALLIAIGSGWLYFKIRDWKIMKLIKQPETDVSGMYFIAVQSILPAALVVCTMAAIDQLCKAVFQVNNLQEGLEILMERLLMLTEGNFVAGLNILIAIHLMWFFGVHGSNVLDVVIRRNYSLADGTVIYSKTFQDVFVIMGGCGAVLGLVLALLLFSRKKVFKRVAKLALPGVLFNISEVIIFGLPLIFNPIFFVPFLLVPLVNYFVSYGAMAIGLVPKVIHQVEWTAPIILSGYQATGSWAGSLLQLMCLMLDILLYLPFIRLFERQSDRSMRKKVELLVELLQGEEDVNQVTSLTGRQDTLGSVARLLASDLRRALDNKELYLLYQPQVDGNEQCVGAEALLRWDHPIVGLIYPPLIVRLAKESGLLSRMEEYIFDNAAAALSVVERQTDRPCKISVNITNESLMWDGFENMVDDCVKRYDISRELLWMEITEQDALSSSIDISNKLENLKKKGHKFLIDDFGMGHTSLLYLQSSSFEIVKIDGAITREILENERYSDILKSIVYLGGLLHFMTVAEFVETKEQVERLRELGIDAFQGFYYSKPIPLEELVEWLKKH